MHVSRHLNYYLSSNNVTGVDRKMDDIFGLCNIVIDIDNHDNNPDVIRHLSLGVQNLLWRAKRDLWDAGVCPAPNSVVRTGRGVQMWWAIKPCYGGKDGKDMVSFYEEARSRIIAHVKAMMAQYEPDDSDINPIDTEFCGLRVDDAPSTNTVGYFRLPLTYNTTAK